VHRGTDRTEDRRVETIRRWLVLAGLTLPLSVGPAALSVPSPALFAGLLVATVLALAPAAVPRAATTGGQAVIGVDIGVLARPETLAGPAQDWLAVLRS
jgi:uncharacterized protein